MTAFKAFLITRDEATKAQSVGFQTLTPDDLMPGDVDIRVEYSTVNYKDGLAITGKLPVVRRFPMIPGADLAGTVMASRSPDFSAGDRVVVNGWGMGEIHYGGYSEMARVPAGFPIHLPEGFTTADAMAIGTAGYTAMLAVIALEAHGLTPDRGPVVVTGAAGGVGSMATALLSDLGYTVHAVTGRPNEHDYLRSLGATEIVDRAELSGQPKMLGKERWAAAIDAVGGTLLANVIASTMERGAVAAVGNAAGWEIPTSAAPFILRGVSLLGIESVRAPKSERLQAWKRLAADLDRGKLAAMTTAMDFHAVENAARDIVEGKVRGRLVVGISQLSAAAQQPRPEAKHADQDQVQRDHVVEQPRHDQDEDAGDQRDDVGDHDGGDDHERSASAQASEAAAATHPRGRIISWPRLRRMG